MDELPGSPAPPSHAALVALRTDLHAACQTRGYAATGMLRLPLWTAAPATGELMIANESNRIPASVLVTIPWSAETAAALARATPSGSLAIDFCWTRPLEREWRDSPIEQMADNLIEAMEDVADLQALTVTIPTRFTATTWTVGPIDLRDTWQIALADLHDPATRATVVARIAAHAIVGIEWL